MGYLLSHEAEIGTLRFRPFPTRPRAMRIVRCGSYVLLGLDEKGRLYTNVKPLRDHAALSQQVWSFLDDVLRGLIRLGVVPPAVADEHKRAARERDRRQDARHTLSRTVPELEKHYGVKLTAAQRRRIEKVAEATR